MSSQPSEQSRSHVVSHVVRPLSRAVARSCSRPGCPSPAAATLTFAYADRQVIVEDLTDQREPSAYDLCIAHADRTTPPHGWELADERSDDVDVDARPLGERGTVALIAEMLGRTRPDAQTPDAQTPDAQTPDAQAPDAEVPGAPEHPEHGGPQRQQGALFASAEDRAQDGRASSW